MLFHFQNKEAEKFFELIENNLKMIHPRFQAAFQTFLKDKEKIINTLQLPYSIAKLEATNHLIKLIKRNIFGFRNFENFKKRIFIALNIKKRKDKFRPFSILAFFQLTTIDKEPKKDTHLSILVNKSNREDRIRTCDTLVPNQVLYQAELLPELNRKNAP